MRHTRALGIPRGLGSYGEAAWDPWTDTVVVATGDAGRGLIRVPTDARDWTDWLPVDCTP